MIEESLLDNIIAPGGLSVLFQPIIAITNDGWKLHSLECLARGPKGSNAESADVLFEYVRRKGAEMLVDRVCIAAALRAASKLPGEPNLSINVNASTLGRDPDFLRFLVDTSDQCSVALSRVIVEIVEHTPYWDPECFRNILEGLRAAGVAIALDDVGLGYSNYRMALDCRPDYFKADRYIVKGIASDFHRQAVLESISHLAWRFGARVVAEGIETLRDFDSVSALGVDLVQGYYFARALTADALIENELLTSSILTQNLEANEGVLNRQFC
jgi:EAL domain-containing protein (putative c-di-GMP-specific phosphodiesterase class I)